MCRQILSHRAVIVGLRVWTMRGAIARLEEARLAGAKGARTWAVRQLMSSPFGSLEDVGADADRGLDSAGL